MKIAIATPCQDQVAAGYAYDLARLVGASSQVEEIQLAVLQNRGTIIPQQRATLVAAAREAEAEAILWIDSDMRFPSDSLLRLLNHDEPIVATNYPTRRPPVYPTAEHREQGFLRTPEHAMGLAEVTQCGFGLILTRMEVFDKIAAPYFAIGFTKDGEYSGEDFFFCAKARASGYRILIDQGLSRDVRHIGSIEYTNEHALIALDQAAKPKLEVVG